MRKGTSFLAFILSALPAVATSAFSGDRVAANDVSDLRTEEKIDRATDEAALSSKYAAIKSFDRLLTRPENSDRRPLILLRLAEALQQAADMDYRIQFFKRKKRNPTANDRKPGVVSEFGVNKLTLRSLEVLSDLEKMPASRVDMGRVRYLRAVALRDVGRRDEAVQEFERFIREFSTRDEVPQSRFALVNLLRDLKNFSGATVILNAFRYADSAPSEAYRLDLLYLCYMEMNDLASALKVVDLESGRIRRMGASARLADLERAYDHAIRAYLSSIEMKTPGLTIEKLYGALKEMNSGPALGRAMFQVAQTLRVKEWREPLLAWKNLMQTYERGRPEWREVLWVLAEYELFNNRLDDFRKLFVQIQEVLKEQMGREIGAFKQKIELVLLERSLFLTARLKEMSDPVSIASLRLDLNTVYESFIACAPENHPKLPEVRLNLAENAFKVENFSLATVNYLWLVHFRSGGRKLASSSVNLISTPDLILKAVASRYEEFRASGRIPKELRARPMGQQAERSVEAKLAAWLSWIDRLYEYSKKGQKVSVGALQSLEGFEFEANRVLYAEGHLRQAVERLSAFVDQKPKSAYALSSGVLVVDTFVLSQDWERARISAMRTRALLTEGEKNISERLYDVAAESTFQLVSSAYQEKEFARALKEGEAFQKTFFQHPREKDVLAIAVQSAIATQERGKARTYINQLITSHSRSPEGIDAFRLRAEFEEADLEFSAASQDLRRFLISQVASKTGDVRDSIELRKKTLFLAWISGDMVELQKTLEFQVLCDKHLKSECDLYGALLRVGQNKPISKEEMLEAKEKALYDAGPDRALWAVIYMKGDPNLTTDQRFHFMETIVSDWGKLDPLVQFSVYQWAQQVLVESTEFRRREILTLAKMQTQPAWIRNRSTLLEDFERRAQVPLGMPWARVQTAVLASLAGAYMDFIRDIDRFRSGLKGLSEADMGAINASLDELRGTAQAKLLAHAKRGLEIAAQGGVEEADALKVVQLVAQFKEDRGDVVLPPADIAHDTRLSANFMNEVEGGDSWQAGNRTHPDFALRFKGLWAYAVNQKSWASAAYLMRIAKEKKLLNEYTYGRAQAVLFDSIGARSEGLQQLEFGMDQLVVGRSQAALLYMLALSVHSLSKEKTLKYLDLVEQYWRKGAKFQFDGPQAKLLLYAAAWAKYDFPGKMNSSLIAVSKSGEKEGG